MHPFKNRQNRELRINFFIEETENAVCAVLYNDEQAPIACLRVTDELLMTARLEVVRWLNQWDITMGTLNKIVARFVEEHGDWHYLVKHGCLPDGSHLGSRSARRLPPELSN